MNRKTYTIITLIACVSLFIAFILFLIESISILYPMLFTLLGFALLIGVNIYSYAFKLGCQVCSWHFESIMTNIGYQEEEIENIIDCLKEKL